jgi:ABC-type uncharacterized transport system permease subunit
VALALAGALGGLAGSFMIQGEQYLLKDGFSSGTASTSWINQVAPVGWAT